MKNRKILIVSYKLGTEDGTGGRRWLAYGLALIKKGYDVSFLTYRLKLPSELLQQRDKIYFLKTNYPLILKTSPRIFFQKLRYKAGLLLWKFRTKGLLYDETALTQNKFLKAVYELIEKRGINCLIISGAPFSLLYFGALVKRKYPQINLISDIRDAWTQGIGYGIKNISSKRFKYEYEREKEVLKASDHVLVASVDIRILENKINPNKEIIVLPNFSDPGQYDLGRKIQRTQKNQIAFTHIGSVNINIDKYWLNFLSNIDRIIRENFIDIKVNFFGNQNESFRKYVDNQNYGFVRFFDRLDKKSLSPYMQASDFFVFFKHDDFPNSFPTKFYDYILFQKPLICYSKEGAVTKEIRDNNIGRVFSENTSKEEFLDAINSYWNNSQVSKYDFKKFSIESNLLSLEKILN